MMRLRLPAVALSFFAMLVCTSVALLGSRAQAQSETVIHSFQSSSGLDGMNPSGGLVVDSNGAVYGVTVGGGADGSGAVYKLSPPNESGTAWKESILYSFVDGSGGGIPYGPLLLGERSHVMYGTASRGGALYGVVFELGPPIVPGGPWVEAVLHTFAGGKDGEYPESGVISNSRGTLYGSTLGGGKYQSGTIFRLSPPTKSGAPWIESVLYSFTGTSDGGSPSGLVEDSLGALYGTTSRGGQYGYGTVFKLSPPASGGPWIESVLYAFTGASDGGEPLAALTFDSAGSLYGTTLIGGSGTCTNSDGVVVFCGTVFRLTPPTSEGLPWTESVLYDFLSGSDGAFPQSTLSFDGSGALYGTTPVGGTFGEGTVFELSPLSGQGGAWTELVLHDFGDGTDGANPGPSLLELGSSFYGTTWGGGSKSFGTVFGLAE
ncbi:MAG: choice-of-anchor tandem repeat GloVer-containing protein [Candidatus Sulfotelmatobacter sp.]